MTAVISSETLARDEIVRQARSLFERGLTHGATGNISVRLDSGEILVTPTGSSFGDLEAGQISVVDKDGRHLRGDKPSKEAFLHVCVYCERAHSSAVVHLHSTHAVAVSVLPEIDPENVLPPITAYSVMRVGKLKLVPYYPPGDTSLALAVRDGVKGHKAVLLANHGPVVSGDTLRDAVFAVEELEETAKLLLLLRGSNPRLLSQQQVDDLSPPT